MESGKLHSAPNIIHLFVRSFVITGIKVLRTNFFSLLFMRSCSFFYIRLDCRATTDSNAIEWRRRTKSTIDQVSFCCCSCCYCWWCCSGTICYFVTVTLLNWCYVHLYSNLLFCTFLCIFSIQFWYLSKYRLAPPNPAYSFLNTIRYSFDESAQSDANLCTDHDHELLKPQVISTWMPSGVGSKPGKRTIFAETQVCCKFIYVRASM